VRVVVSHDFTCFFFHASAASLPRFGRF
jgi:hypothetical protein